MIAADMQMKTGRFLAGIWTVTKSRAGEGAEVMSCTTAESSGTRSVRFEVRSSQNSSWNWEGA